MMLFMKISDVENFRSIFDTSPAWTLHNDCLSEIFSSGQIQAFYVQITSVSHQKLCST